MLLVYRGAARGCDYRSAVAGQHVHSGVQQHDCVALYTLGGATGGGSV